MLLIILNRLVLKNNCFNYKELLLFKFIYTKLLLLGELLLLEISGILRLVGKQQKARDKEGELLYEATELDVVNITRHSRYKRIRTIPPSTPS